MFTLESKVEACELPAPSTLPFLSLKMTTPLTTLSSYTTKFEAYPSDLIVFAEANTLKLPSLSSLKGQALALLAQPEIRGTQHIEREHATKFFQQIGMETSDSIQPFNKGFGLKEIKVKGKICLCYPFEKDTVNQEKRKGAVIHGDKDAAIQSVKDYYAKHIVEVPNSLWQVGHLDPTIGDASEKNLAWQPPIQGKYRDRFKFDSSFLKMWPTAEQELIPKIDDYYTEKEQRLLLDALLRKFEPTLLDQLRHP